jgi:hypothetical protein
MAFRVGQKVVCVNTGPMRSDRGNLLQTRRLVEGGVYTITAVMEAGGIFGVQVLEAEPDGATNWGFIARRFRPVVERKTDISIFTAMLNPEQVPA